MSKTICSSAFIAMACFFSSQTLAQSDTSTCASTKNIKKETFQSSYKELRKQGLRTSFELCWQLFDKPEHIGPREHAGDIDLQLDAFFDTAKKEASNAFVPSELGGFDFSAIIDKQKQAAKADTNGKRTFDTLFYSAEGDNFMDTRVGFKTLGNFDVISEAYYEQCKKIRNTYQSCVKAVEDFSRAFNSYRYHYNHITFDDNLKKISRLQANWSHYLESARPQTLLDIVFTTWMEDDHYRKPHLVGPSDKQWFAIHPSIVYEHANDDENSQDKMGLAVEWLGVNYWRRGEKWYQIPFGVSIASVYTDRKEIASTGTGLLFTFDNKYSLGVVDHSGETGIFLSADLTELFNSKKSQFKQYKSKIKQTLNNELELLQLDQ